MFEFVNGSFIGIPLSSWLTAAFFFLLLTMIGKLFYILLKTIIPKLTARTKTDLDDLLIETIQEPIIMVFTIVGLYVAFQQLAITDPALVLLFSQIMFLLSVLNIAWFISRFTDRFVVRFFQSVARRTDRETLNHVAPLIAKSLKFIIWTAAILLAGDNLGYDITTILAGAGIAGIAIAFAAQETIANVFGGISLILDKTIKRGDRVQLESGELGIIHDITLRSTRIQTYDNELIIVPNGQLTKTRIKNFSTFNQSLRVSILFTVVHGTPIAKMEKVVQKALLAIPGVSKKHPIEITFEEILDANLRFKAWYWMDNFETDQAWPNETRKAVYEALLANGIYASIPAQTTIDSQQPKRGKKK